MSEDKKDTKTLPMKTSKANEIQGEVEALQEKLNERINQVASADPICGSIHGQISGLNKALEILNDTEEG